jgi:hypothetical protein
MEVIELEVEYVDDSAYPHHRVTATSRQAVWFVGVL